MNVVDPLFARWHEIDPLFQAMLVLAPDERIAYLRQACGTDEELLRIVGGLVAHIDDANDLLEDRTLVITAQNAVDDDEDVNDGGEIGQQIGPYRLANELGRGGTGTVYRADRVDGAFAQQVAIKLLRRGLDTDDVLARFRAERQILASLSHPNIARLFDGGATPEGRPYLVMELVEGTPITTYCDTARLTIENRLRLFASVGRAVEYAHRNLVIHRDLKPSNILVSADGEVKLLDFGIAKLLDTSADPDISPRTRTGVRLLTPEYASPEQLRGEAISTASDVYQLGVLLCQLLTGARPHPDEGRIPGPLGHGAGDAPAQAPSALAGRAPGRERGASARPVDIAEFAAACRTDPRRLRRRLRGDLDTIVLKALRPEPERRYASVAELVADVERHLHGQPLTARPDHWSYRARKFVGRHPGWTAAGLVCILAVGGYLVALAGHAERLAAERDRALVESAKVQQVSDFLLALFEASDPDYADGEALSALDLVRRGESNASQLNGNPALRAQMLSVIGTLYMQLGEYDRSEPMLRGALQLLTEIHQGPDREIAQTLGRLGDVLNRRGRPKEAEPLLRDAIEMARLTGDAAAEADGYTDLGNAMFRSGDHRGAEPLYRRALDIRQQTFGERHAKTADGLHNLAMALHTTGRTEEAEPLFQRALALKRELLHPEHSSITATLSALAGLYSWKGNHAAAEPLLRESVRIKRARLGPRHSRVGDDLNALGEVLLRRGEYAAAEKELREALAIGTETLGGRHAYIGGILSNLSHAVLLQGRAAEAVDLRRQAVAIARDQWGDAHVITGSVVHNLAAALDRVDEWAEAEALYREALAIFERVRPGGHPRASWPLATLGELLTKSGRAAEAEPLLRRALALRSDPGHDAASAAEVESILGACLAALGQGAEAESLLRRAVSELHQTHGADHELTRAARARLVGFDAMRAR